MTAGLPRQPESELSVESFIFDPRPDYPFLITAKRYRPCTQRTPAPGTPTLIFAHGTGFHKEHWEPALARLFTRARELAEAWSFDCPNHGDAAVLNEAALRWGYDHIFGWEEYARALHAVLTGRASNIRGAIKFSDCPRTPPAVAVFARTATDH